MLYSKLYNEPASANKLSLSTLEGLALQSTSLLTTKY